MPKFKTKDVTPVTRRNFPKNVPSSSILYLASCMAVSTKAVNADIYDYLKNYLRMIVE
jgi:hypothetical protein